MPVFVCGRFGNCWARCFTRVRLNREPLCGLVEFGKRLVCEAGLRRWCLGSSRLPSRLMAWGRRMECPPERNRAGQGAAQQIDEADVLIEAVCEVVLALAGRLWPGHPSPTRTQLISAVMRPRRVREASRL